MHAIPSFSRPIFDDPHRHHFVLFHLNTFGVSEFSYLKFFLLRKFSTFSFSKAHFICTMHEFFVMFSLNMAQLVNSENGKVCDVCLIFSYLVLIIAILNGMRFNVLLNHPHMRSAQQTCDIFIGLLPIFIAITHYSFSLASYIHVFSVPMANGGIWRRLVLLTLCHRPSLSICHKIL